MNAFLRDSIWQFIGTIVALVGVIVSIIGYAIQKKRKSLAYDIITATQLIGLSDDLDERIQVLFDNQPVNNIWLVLVRIFNDGNVPIQTSDYERPIEIAIRAPASVLYAEAVQAIPADLEIGIAHSEHSLTLSPTLLNPMDSITIKALVSNLSDPPLVSARIVGIKKIRQVGRVAAFPSSMPLLLAGWMLILGSGLVGMWLAALPIVIGGLIAGFLMLTVPVLYDYRYRRFWTRWMFG